LRSKVSLASKLQRWRGSWHDSDVLDEDDLVSLVVFGALSVLALWWLYVRPAREERRRAQWRVGSRREAERVDERDETHVAPAQGARATAAAPRRGRSAGDDLSRIDGIGPATVRRLRAARITTYIVLAGTDVERLREIVRDVGLGLADPSSWPDQARLAAAEDWDALRVFQENLRLARQS
jgi:predicted flap endonuclease-1-like 5' DNA nuclease